jgi:hypothetical protein
VATSSDTWRAPSPREWVLFAIAIVAYLVAFSAACQALDAEDAVRSLRSRVSTLEFEHDRKRHQPPPIRVVVVEEKD